MTVSRRAVLGLGLAAAGVAVGGCSRAARRTSRDGGASESSTRTASTSKAPPAAPSARPTTATRTPRGPAVEIAHGPRTRPEVALTFHGAGDPGIARDLLAIVAAHHARITVLAVGTWLESNPHMAEEIVAGGHELGNHTYRHLGIDHLDAAAARAEIVRCRDLLVSQVGSAGAHFRPSQTQHASALVLDLAGRAGYPVSLSYDVDSLDFTDPRAAAIVTNVAAARAGSVVSLHFGHRGTVAAMPAILDGLAARSLRAVTATELLRP